MVFGSSTGLIACPYDMLGGEQGFLLFTNDTFLSQQIDGCSSLL